MTHALKDRREFLKIAGSTLAATALMACGRTEKGGMSKAAVPAYLKDFADLYGKSPKKAAYAWFRSAEFGMFMHYGLYSLLGGEYRGRPILNINDAKKPVAEWAQFHGRIPVAEYAELKNRFTAENFDADMITDLALEADMRYFNITTRHHDGFCLFDSAYTDFNSMNSPAGRDLVGELAEQCNAKGLGLFLYYSHGRDWKHSHAPTREWAPNARPDYDYTEESYAELNPGLEHDIGNYARFMDNQITELLTNYGPIAGIWLDGEGVLKSNARRHERSLEYVVKSIHLGELYAKARKLQPNALMSYKQGVEGSEDFLTPERHSYGLDKLGKMLEINTTLQEHSWGYNKFTKHRKTPEEIMELLAECAALNANCCLNTGPMGDGTLVPEEVATYREVGRRRRVMA